MTEYDKSEITLLIEEKDFARIMFLPGKPGLTWTGDQGEVVTMPVHQVIGYCGPRCHD